MASGKSKSQSNRFGVRRTVKGKELSSRSLRKKGKYFLSECSKEELIKSGVENG